MSAARIALLPTCIAAILMPTACTRSYVMTDRGPQAYYQTGHPTRDTSRELERILRSVKRIHVVGFYTTYRFLADQRVTDADLLESATFARAAEQFTFDHPKAGTATITEQRGSVVNLITNDHVVRMPERMVVYFGDDARGAAADAPRYVESVSLLMRQLNFVIGLPGSGAFEVIARDSVSDLALIRVALDESVRAEPVQVLRLTQGDPSRLVWGSFVYVLGFPRGLRMVTTAVVSEPGQGRDHEFLLDGLFNRGISGGLILAVRGDSNELEWVGIARSASAQTEIVLVPEQRRIEEDRLLVPYEGRLYAERIPRIEYGITFAVPMTAIQRFLQASGTSSGAATLPGDPRLQRH